MKADFGSTHTERRLIRLALKDYLEQRAGGSHSAMADQMIEYYRAVKRRGDQQPKLGAPVDRAKLSKCLNHGEKRADAATYRKVAGYLMDTGFYPPADMEDLTFGLLPFHFGGGHERAREALARLPGVYAYEEIALDGGRVSSGRLIIDAPTASQFAPVRTEPDDPAHVAWEGVAFCDDRPSACLILRGSTWGQPRLCMIHGFTSPSLGAPFTALSGDALTSERDTRGAPTSQLSLIRLEEPQIKAAE